MLLNESKLIDYILDMKSVLVKYTDPNQQPEQKQKKP